MKSTPFTPVPNTLLEALARVRITGRQFRLILLLLRQTDGYQDSNGNRRKEDHLGPKFLSQKTGLSKENCYHELAKLKALGIVASPAPGVYKVTPPSLWQVSSVTLSVVPDTSQVSSVTPAGVVPDTNLNGSKENPLEKTIKENSTRAARAGDSSEGRSEEKKPPDPRVKEVLRDIEKKLGYQIPNYGKEWAAVKRALTMGYSPEEVRGCWEKMKDFAFWQGKWLPLAKVAENLGEFRAGRLSDRREHGALRGYSEKRGTQRYTPDDQV